MTRTLLAAAALLSIPLMAGETGEYRRRVAVVTRTPGFAALWDFVKRENGSSGRFTAHQPKGATADLALDAINYVHEYWNEGRPADYGDFPLMGRGPFGQAIRIRAETSPDFRPCLLVPRARLHNTRIDVKGPGRSVSMVAWLIRESGTHAVAGIWHEGTDLKEKGPVAARVERGMRQYAIFAGLAGNPGASAAHVSENGGRSFGDIYARNMAVTPDVIPVVPADAPSGTLDGAWGAAGFVFDNANNRVTAYWNGKAEELWIDNPEQHRFYQWPARAWPQSYAPPERRPRSKQVLEERAGERVELHVFEYTKVRVTLRRDEGGKYRVVNRELASLKANPFWFPHDLYTPGRIEEGGPFTIGRVIHSGRSVGTVGYLGGVAVFDRALPAAAMRRLAELARPLPAGRAQAGRMHGDGGGRGD